MATIKYKDGNEWKKVSIGGGGSITLDTEMSDTSTNAVSNKVIKEYVDNAVANSGGGTGRVAELMIELTYDELVSLRDSNSLVKGMKYRITDYETMTSQEGTQSAGHPFDIIVTALDGKTLDEKASAIWSARDNEGYFAKSNLPAWDVRYCLDNDTSRFAWAISSSPSISFNGEMLGIAGALSAVLDGTIEFEGATYHSWAFTLETLQVYLLTTTDSPSEGDFALVYHEGTTIGQVPITGVSMPQTSGKGVVFRLIDEQQNDCPYDFKNILFVRKIKEGAYDAENGTETFVYTFNVYKDGVNRDCSANCRYNIMAASSKLPNNVFLNVPTFGIVTCYNNRLSLDCKENTMGNQCISNVLGMNCYRNMLGDQCQGNVLGMNCYNNTFTDSCECNVLGSNCHDNIFERSSSHNVLGDYCNANHLTFNCDYNVFGGGCENNILSLNCQYNKFGDSCDDNILGDYCSYNEFLGNNSKIVLGAQGVNSNYLHNRFKAGVFRVKPIEPTRGSGVQHYVFGVIPNPSSVMIEIAVEGGRKYETFVTANKTGEIIQYTIDDIINA